MLKVVEGVRLLGATDPQHGNVQTLLERLLVEAVAGNYRHFLHERLAKAQQYPEEPEQHCWPPLMSNERQVGGAKLATVRDNLRHASLATTSMYLHSDDIKRASQMATVFSIPPR